MVTESNYNVNSNSVKNLLFGLYCAYCESHAPGVVDILGLIVFASETHAIL